MKINNDFYVENGKMIRLFIYRWYIKDFVTNQPFMDKVAKIVLRGCPFCGHDASLHRTFAFPARWNSKSYKSSYMRENVAWEKTIKATHPFYSRHVEVYDYTASCSWCGCKQRGRSLGEIVSRWNRRAQKK